MTGQFPADEAERLRALQEYEILDTPPEDSFDRLVELAAHICGTPIALISLIDETRQWFKAKVGLNVNETSRDVSFCAHAIRQPDLFVVPDASQDPRFANNPLVAREPRIRFYAGSPLVAPSGQPLGTLCVIDRVARQLDEKQKRALRVLSTQVVAYLELRRANRARDQALGRLQRDRPELDALVDRQTEQIEQLHGTLDREIAARESAESKARSVEERYQLLVEKSSDAIMVLDASGIQRFISPAIENLLGYTPEELLGKSGFDLVHPDEVPGVRDQFQYVLSRPHGAVKIELRCRHKNGSWRVLEAVGENFLDDERIRGVVANVRDVTEHRAAQERLTKNLERVSALNEIDKAVNSSLEIRKVVDLFLEKLDLFLPYAAATVWLWDKEKREIVPIAFANINEDEWRAEIWKAWRGLTQQVFYSRAPVMVRDVRQDPWTLDPHFFIAHGLVSFLGVPLVAEDQAIGVLGFYTKQEHRFSDEEIAFAIKLAGQAAVCIHNSQLYEEIKQYAATLEQANKTKSEFLSVMSHELRTPLNIIMGYANLLKDGTLGALQPAQDDALRKVTAQGHELLGMVNNILRVTSLEVVDDSNNWNTVNLSEFIDLVRAGCADTPGTDIAMIWDCPSGLPVLKTNSEQLKHVIVNLINNAIKFTEQGEIKIAVRHRPDAARIEITVADTGIGIPKESFETIFEIFRQVDSSSTRAHGGVGLGLYIVKMLTEKLGGKVVVQSEVGRGSVFTVSLPLVP